MIATENLSDSERIAVLRRRLRERKFRNETGFLRAKALVTAESLRASESVASWQVRRGLLTRDRLCEVAFDYDPLEAFVGRLRLDAHVANNAAYADQTGSDVLKDKYNGDNITPDVLLPTILQAITTHRINAKRIKETLNNPVSSRSNLYLVF